MNKVTITIGNSYSNIQGLTTEQYRKIKKLLSYTNNSQAAYFSGGFAHRRYLIDKKGNFPTGLLKRVERHLIKCKTPYDKRDSRRRPNVKAR